MTKNIEKSNIDLGGTYAENVLSAYIWKALNPPEANQIVNYDFNKPIPTIEIVSKDYMNYIGNNVQLAEQELIQVFFNRSKYADLFSKNPQRDTIELNEIKEKSQNNKENDKEIILTHEKFVELVQQKVKTDFYASQYSINTTSEDYWKRALIFGSTSLKLDNSKIRYVYDAETGRPLRIEGIFLKPNSDNYDSESSNGLASIINPILRRLTDPYGLGKKVEIKFSEEYYPYNFSLNKENDENQGIFTAEQYWDYVKEHKNIQNPYIPKKLSPFDIETMISLWNGMKEMQKLQSIQYTDVNGKLVVLGTEENDNLKEYSVGDIQLDNLIDGLLKSEMLAGLSGSKKIKEWVNNNKESATILGNVLPYLVTLVLDRFPFLKQNTETLIYNLTDDNGTYETLRTYSKANYTALWTGIDLFLNVIIEDLINKFEKASKNGITYVGREGDDIITGTDKSDHLLGGKGNDTLNGKDGGNTLEGGEDKDIYEINHGDTIKDNDNDGIIKIKNSSGHYEELKALFYLAGDNGWRTIDGQYTAIRIANSLRITNMNNQEIFYIYKYFETADHGIHTRQKMGITLQMTLPEQTGLPTGKIEFPAENGKNASFISAGQDVHYIGSDKTDRVTSNINQGIKADLGDGSDFFGGNNKSDIANGGNGTDILIGSRNNPKTHKDDDNDRFEGGNGRDLIDAGSGDDVAYGGNANKSPDGLKEYENGDWIVLGKGNDYSIGGDGKDIMMGGEGQDTMMGGKGHDLMLGDGDIKFNYATRTVNTYNHQSVDTHTLFLTGIDDTLNNRPSLTTNDYQYSPKAKTWQKSDNAHFVFVIDKENFNWELKFVEEGKDYEIEAPIKIKDSDNNHLFSPYGDPNNPELAILHNDFLYGDEGHDLIMGQIGHDYIHAGDGDDIVYGDDKRNPNIKGNDVMNGGKGYNRLFGGDGDDTYIVTREDMKFMTYNIIDDSEGFDTLDLSDFNIQEVFIDLNTPNDLFLSSSMGSLMAHIKNWSESNKSIEEFRFADGIVTADDITSRLQPYEYPILIHEPPIDDEC